MVERRCLAAFTECHFYYPAYISVNLEIDRTIVITMRERGKKESIEPAKTVNMTVGKKDLQKFVDELQAKVNQLPD